MLSFSQGSMLQCLDSLMKWQVLQNNKDVQQLCEETVNAVCLNISTGKVMKVRWNACYASGGILKTQSLFKSGDGQKSKLIAALLPSMVESPNFKVNKRSHNTVLKSDHCCLFAGTH